MLPWLLVLAADAATAGIYAACSFVAALPTPMHLAISNLLVPQLAHVERRQGLLATDRLVRQATLWLTAAMIAYAAAILLVSSRLVPWFYGPQFTGTQHPLMVLVIGWAITGATLPAARALLVIKRPDQMLWSQMIGIVANLALGVPLVAAWGATGAAYAALAGAAVKGALSWQWYVAGVRRQLAAAPIQSPLRSATAPHEFAWTPRPAAELVTEDAR
jgi:O-antigen/teichoic acid export membrane protein